MTFQTIVFYTLAGILLLSSLRVITAKDPVHAALYLVLSFFQAAMIWMLLKAEFLAIALVLVYVGAVMVLFLFVVMMLDINIDSVRKGFWRHMPLAGTIGNGSARIFCRKLEAELLAIDGHGSARLYAFRCLLQELNHHIGMFTDLALPLPADGHSFVIHAPCEALVLELLGQGFVAFGFGHHLHIQHDIDVAGAGVGRHIRRPLGCEIARHQPADQAQGVFEHSKAAQQTDQHALAGERFLWVVPCCGCGLAGCHFCVLFLQLELVGTQLVSQFLVPPAIFLQQVQVDDEGTG